VPRSARALFVALVALGTAGCEAWYNRVPSPDHLWYIIPWFDHMIQQRSVHPYETAAVPRNTPPGTVPITGGEVDWSTEFRSAASVAAASQVGAARAVNPYAGGVMPADSLRRTGGPAVAMLPRTLEAAGDSLFGTYCSVCHGESGNGRAPITSRFPAPSLLTDQARGASDGYIYGMIRFGRGLMPRYGDKVYRPEDRWAIVNHVRRLQAAGAPTASGPAAIAPAPAGGGAAAP
jgi:mono/diheme cytochrome c family protein